MNEKRIYGWGGCGDGWVWVDDGDEGEGVEAGGRLFEAWGEELECGHGPGAGDWDIGGEMTEAERSAQRMYEGYMAMHAELVVGVGERQVEEHLEWLARGYMRAAEVFCELQWRAEKERVGI